jgi:DNA-directed RNA polymerase specialized sigma24 family protein
VERRHLAKNKWSLTQGAFDRLLAQLDLDCQQAGAKYEALRRKLVKFFEWRGCSFPEDLADDTINRVAMNLEAGENIRQFPAYCAGIARRVFLESLRVRQREEALRSAPQISGTPSDSSERRKECLERCLQELSRQSFQLIVQYYQEEKQARIAARRNLAVQLDIPLNALRIRAYRIRASLEACVERQMAVLHGNNSAERSHKGRGALEH